MQSEKFCPNCKTIRKVGKFIPNKARYNGLSSVCRNCHNLLHRAKTKEWKTLGLCINCGKNPGFNQSTRCKKCIEDNRKNYIQRVYGISQLEYNTMVLIQNNRCAICNREEKFISEKHIEPRPLSVDHSHTTGKIRALLCTDCNRALGQFKDSFEILFSAYLYLKKYESNSIPILELSNGC